MDREISPEIKKRRNRRLIIRTSAVALTLAAAFVMIKYVTGERYIESSLDIATVDRGGIEISINCAGTIVPLVEEVISAPITSRILEVYKKNGDTLTAGEPILKLELSEMETLYRQKMDEKEMMASKLVQLRVKTENSISDLVMQQQVGHMQLRQLESELEGEKHLQELGASTPDKVRRAELAYQESKLRLEQLAQKIVNERKNGEAELRVHELELSILEKALDEQSRLLTQARVMSPRNATLTFLNDQVGAQVGQGERLAMLADLTRFKVEAEIAERHRNKFTYGSRVLIRTAQGDIPGSVYNINPAVTNGIMSFTSVPDDPGHPGLASGIKVEVEVVHGRRSDVLRLPPSSWYQYGRGDYIVWVVKDGEARKRKITTGEGSYDYVEIIDGLGEGERVIISDTEKLDGKKQLKLK